MPEYGINGTTLNLEHIQLKCFNAADWPASYVLLAGEIGVEIDTHKAKIGDGTTAWSALGYSADPEIQGIVDTLSSSMTQAEGNITNLQGRMTTAENTITSHGTRLDTAEGDIDAAEGRLDTAEADIDALETKDTQHETRMTTIEAKDTAQDGRLDALEGITTLSANSFRE